MNLGNNGALTEAENKELIREAIKAAKNHKNAASTGCFDLHITGKIIKGRLVDNNKDFAIESVASFFVQRQPKAAEQNQAIKEAKTVEEVKAIIENEIRPSVLKNAAKKFDSLEAIEEKSTVSSK